MVFGDVKIFYHEVWRVEFFSLFLQVKEEVKEIEGVEESEAKCLGNG